MSQAPGRSRGTCPREEHEGHPEQHLGPEGQDKEGQVTARDSVSPERKMLKRS